MANLTSPVDLVGYTDILLIDRESKQVVEHVRKRNQITEPFARWLLTGNLCTHNASSQDSSSASLVVDSNSISRFLASRSIPNYQAVKATCGTGEYGIYLLSKEVDIKSNTQIPPYLKANLSSVTDRVNSDNKAVLVYYGTASSINDSLTMAVDNGSCKWSTLEDDPTFQTTYVKDDNTEVTIKSVVLGARHGQLSDGQTAAIVVRQSPVILPQNWDTTWNNAGTTNSSTLVAPVIISAYFERDPGNWTGES